MASTLNRSRPNRRRAEKLPRSVHADKFRTALAGLIGIGAGALLVAVAIAVAHGKSSASVSSQAWSQFKPDATGGQGQLEIADYVAPLYRLTPAAQLDTVSPLQVTGVDSSGNIGGSGITVAVNINANPAKQNLSLLNGTTAAYRVCGLSGTNCQVAGTPTASMMLLERREALELALYTFKYEPSVQFVVADLPPGYIQGTATKPVPHQTVALLLARKELQPLLSQPLEASLAQDPPAVPELSTWIKGSEAGLVDQFTSSGLFSVTVQSQPDGSNLFVLNQLPTQ